MTTYDEEEETGKETAVEPFRQSAREAAAVSFAATIGVPSGDLLNPLNPELNPICYLLALLAQDFLHVSRIMVKSLILRFLMSYIYGAHILDVSRSHTTTHHSR
jgi:phage-related tail protein